MCLLPPGSRGVCGWVCVGASRGVECVVSRWGQWLDLSGLFQAMVVGAALRPAVAACSTEEIVGIISW